MAPSHLGPGTEVTNLRLYNFYFNTFREISVIVHVNLWGFDFRTTEHYFQQMLAQRWEQPSTAQEERQTITRARRLCKRKRKLAKAKSNAADSKISEFSISKPDGRGIMALSDTSNKFFAVFRMIGIHPKIAFQIFEHICPHLGRSISFLEDILGMIQHRVAIQQFEDAAPCEHEMTLRIRWDPTTMRRNLVEVSPNFCRRIAKMSHEEFCNSMEASDLPLPCPTTEFLCYFIDASLLFGENIHFRTRSVVHVLVLSLRYHTAARVTLRLTKVITAGTLARPPPSSGRPPIPPC